MDNSGQEIEIGWKKELLEGPTPTTVARHRSRSPGKKKNKYHRFSSSSSDGSSASRSSSSSSGSTSDGEKKKTVRKEKREKHKEEKKLKKERRKLEKQKRKEMKKVKKEKRKEEKRLKKTHKKLKETCDPEVPIDLMYSKARAPETQQEYEARQKQIRRVTDPETGRSRLVKGDGEILEEIVSKDRHREINRNATRSDGDYFQRNCRL